MRKKLVKLLFHMLCAAAIVAGLCAAATALQVDGLTLEAGTLPPVAYQLEVIYAPVKCAKIEEINFGPGGDFAILHTRPTGIAGEFSIEDIRYIQKKIGFESLGEGLADTARLRLEHPDASLKELGMMLTPQVGKSGVNHRLRKLSTLAEELRGN